MDAKTILSARAEAQEGFDSRSLSGNIWQLCDDHFVAVVDLLWNHAGLIGVAEICKAPEKDGGLALPPGKAPSKSALQRFWRDSGFRKLLQRHNRRIARDGAAEIAEELRAKPSDYSEANIELIQQTTFELLDEGADAATLKPFVQAVTKLNSLAVEREKLRRAVQTKIDAGLEELAKELPAELMERIREVMTAKVKEAA